MTVNVACRCGQRFAAQPHLYGKTVPCPACGQALAIPRPVNETIAVSCQCGQRFAAQPYLAGKQVTCPSCGGNLMVPHAGAAMSALSAPAPLDNLALEDFSVYSTPAVPSASSHAAACGVGAARTASGTSSGPGLAVIAGIAIGLVALTGATIACLALVNWWGKAGSELDVELALWRESGEPMTAQELEAAYNLSPGATDTTDLWLQASRELKPPQLPTDHSFSSQMQRDHWTIGYPGDHAHVLAANRTALEKLHRATALGGSARYPTDFSQGCTMVMDDVARLQECRKLLELEAFHRSAVAPAGTRDTVRAMWTLSESLRDYPLLVAQLVRVAIVMDAYDTLARNLVRVEYTHADLQSMQEEISRIDYDDGHYKALLGDRVIGWLAQTGEVPLVDEQFQPISTSQGGAISDKLCFLTFSRQFIEATQMEWPGKWTRATEIRDELRRAPGADYAISAELLRGNFASFAATGNAIAHRNSAIVAIALERYRMDNDEFPDRLDAIVPKYLPTIPLDPYDGQPIRYKKLERGCNVYSIGRDNKDDGGRGPREPDYVLTLTDFRPQGTK